MSGPLSGFVIADATNFVFGPVATQLLADMGADVIKIEPVDGDPTRSIGKSRSPGMGSFFLNLNRNKRSMVLDLKTDAGVKALHRLLARSDVFVHNMRSSAISRLGIDYPALKALHPHLVYAVAQGFGAEGAYFDQPAFDDVIQGLTGITGLNASAAAAPAYVPMLLTDKLCGVYLSSAIAMGLVHRARTGLGQLVSVPMFETTTAFNLLEHLADAVFVEPEAIANSPLGYRRVFGKHHRPLVTADGHICVIANTDAQWRRLLESLGLEDAVRDDRFASIGARMKHIDALYDLLAERLVSRPTDDWIQEFKSIDIPCAPANDLEALRADQHLNQSGFFTQFEHPTEGPLLMPAIPIEFESTPGDIRRGPPRLGEHTREILQGLGYLEAEIGDLMGDR